MLKAICGAKKGLSFISKGLKKHQSGFLKQKQKSCEFSESQKNDFF
jgi:hypothetical protein